MVGAAEAGDVAALRRLLEAIILGDGGPARTQIVQRLVAHALQRGQRAIAEILRRAGGRA